MEKKTTKKPTTKKATTKKKAKLEELAPESQPFNPHKPLSFFEKVKKFLGL
jgi:hypothetical protein